VWRFRSLTSCCSHDAPARQYYNRPQRADGQRATLSINADVLRGMSLRTICSIYLPSAAFRRKSSAAAENARAAGRHQAGSSARPLSPEPPPPTQPQLRTHHRMIRTTYVRGEPAEAAYLPSSLLKSRSARSGTSAAISANRHRFAAHAVRRLHSTEQLSSARHGRRARRASSSTGGTAL
jgi:hypothetical protein